MGLTDPMAFSLAAFEKKVKFSRGAKNGSFFLEGVCYKDHIKKGRGQGRKEKGEENFYHCLFLQKLLFLMDEKLKVSSKSGKRK
jgi:hypothetical protein